MATERQPYTGNPTETLDSVLVTGDAIAVQGPCLFWGAIARGSGAAASAATIHDGLNTTGAIRFRLAVSTSVLTVPLILSRPRVFHEGVFVDFSSADMSDVVVLFEPLSPYHTPR